MAKREKSKTVSVKCDKCSAEAMGLPGHRHRRCGGGAGQAPRDKRAERLPYEERGKWQPAQGESNA